MASRRMFSLDVVDTDNFLDMSISAQCLYFHLGMRADDDGFVSSPKKTAKAVGSNEDDLKLLIAKGYLIPFENGVVVISDWNVNNWIRPDRKHGTRFVDEKELLELKDDVYVIKDTLQPIDNQLTTKCHTEVRLGKDRLGKDNNNICPDLGASTSKQKNKKFIPPCLEEVQQYCRERNNSVNAQTFIDFYESKGWMIGKNKMKDWKAAVRTWERQQSYNKPQNSFNQFPQNDYDFEQLEKELLNN